MPGIGVTDRIRIRYGVTPMTYEPTRGDDRINGWWAEIHGTRSRYRKGCRCDNCRAAETAYRREYRADALAVAIADAALTHELQVFCAFCGRVGSRGFQLRHGDGVSPQTGDWCCSNRDACHRRIAANAEETATRASG